MGATVGCWPRPVGVRRCLTRRPAGAGNACQWVSRCGDDHGGGGRPRSIAAPSGAGGRGSASPLHPVARSIPGGAHRHHRDARPRPVGVRRCLTRRPGRAGNDTADARRRSVAIIAACWCVPRVGRAPGAGGRGSASPLQPWGGQSPVNHWCATDCRSPRPVGVRRCLTRPARRAGNDTADARRRSVAIIAACWCVPRVGRAPGAGGRGSASPLQPWGTNHRSTIGAPRIAAAPVLSGSGGA